MKKELRRPGSTKISTKSNFVLLISFFVLPCEGILTYPLFFTFQSEYSNTSKGFKKQLLKKRNMSKNVK